MAAIVANGRATRPVRTGAGRRVLVVAAGAAVVAAAALAAAFGVLGGRAQPGSTHEVLVAVSNLTYSTRDIRVESGQVTVSLANTDAVSHTFTITTLGVDLEVGPGEASRVTFDARPGQYSFVCTIPGHDTPGMRGVLRVTD